MSLENTLVKISSKDCTIQVFGLGYVGFPLSIRLASSGFKVIGIDKDSKKIQNLKNNLLIGSQLNLQDKFLETMKNGKFTPSEEPIKAENPQIGIISVPTPIPDGKVSSDVYVKSASENFLNISKAGDVIVIESSIEVGTTESVANVIESKGFKIGEDYGLCFCPERIDPMNKKWKLENIPRVIYSSDNTTFHIAQQLYYFINNSNLVRVKSPKTAEVVKSFENTFRLVNISLVNELAVLCDKLKINVKDVIDAASTKPFGFFPFYSGAGVGGHCIPKDPIFLLNSAKKLGFDFRTIENALAINTSIPKYIVESIEQIISELNLKKSVLVCGLAYKPDIEDMRDSPGFKIVNELINRGFDVSAYDPYFKQNLLNQYLIENHLKQFNCKILSEINNGSLKDYDCLCIVQHHSKYKFRLEEIYKHSEIPFIYDCQNQLVYDGKSKTVLKGLGLSRNSAG